MRISDWSSDVCSSDLLFGEQHVRHRRLCHFALKRSVQLDTAFLGCRRHAHVEHGIEARPIRQIVGSLDRAHALAQLTHECEQSLGLALRGQRRYPRSEEHTSELQSLMRISYDVF